MFFGGLTQCNSLWLYCTVGEDSDATILWKRQMGGLITRPRSDTLDDREELCQNILIILFTIMWKGVEGSTTEAWKVCVQFVIPHSPPTIAHTCSCQWEQISLLIRQRFRALSFVHWLVEWNEWKTGFVLAGSRSGFRSHFVHGPESRAAEGVDRSAPLTERDPPAGRHDGPQRDRSADESSSFLQQTSITSALNLEWQHFVFTFCKDFVLQSFWELVMFQAWFSKNSVRFIAAQISTFSSWQTLTQNKKMLPSCLLGADVPCSLFPGGQLVTNEWTYCLSASFTFWFSVQE